MKILLIGYGKMGKAIEAIALERGHQIVGKIGTDNQNELHLFDKSNADIAIEFSQPNSAFDNIKYCLDKNLPVISGTTGWLDKKSEIEQLCKNQEGTFLYASNFSIGVNLFFLLNENLAKLMSSQSDYSTSIEEIHHTQKKDAPSGTAISLAEGIFKNINRLKEWSLDKIGKGIIPINAVRKDNVPGTHNVKYSSEIDDIEIKHTAHSRKGFALGAVMVAEWILTKKGILSMSDFLIDKKIKL